MKLQHGWQRLSPGDYRNEANTVMVRRVRPRLWVICKRELTGRMLEPWIDQHSYRTARECFRAIGKWVP